jgi:hypothetical protein
VRASGARALPPEGLPVAIDGVLRGDGDSHRVSYRVPIPYFGFLWRPLVAHRARRIEAAAAAGRPLPTALPWWAPARHAAFPPCPESSSGRTVLAGLPFGETSADGLAVFAALDAGGAGALLEPLDLSAGLPPGSRAG